MALALLLVQEPLSPARATVLKGHRHTISTLSSEGRTETMKGVQVQQDGPHQAPGMRSLDRPAGYTGGPCGNGRVRDQRLRAEQGLIGPEHYEQKRA